MQTTFENLPATVAAMYKDFNDFRNEFQKFRESQPVDGPLMQGEELREWLGISRPTELLMRKKGKLPFVLVNGQYRYHKPTVLKTLTNN